MYDIKNLNIWKTEEKKEQNLKGLRELDLSELNLSVRSYNCLRRANCHTVGAILDLLDAEGNGLRKIRNLGSRSETEIKQVLADLKKEFPSGSVKASDPVLKVVKPAKRTMERPIDDFHLSGGAYRRLKTSGVRYVKDLYEDHLPDEPGWFAVRELFDQILTK